MKRVKNKIGIKINKLTIVDEYLNDKNIKILKCLCDCGEYHITTFSKLKINYTKSCIKCSYNNRKIKPKLYKESPTFKGYQDIPLTLFNRFLLVAKKRNIEFNIAIEDVYNQLINQNKKCAYTDIDLLLDKNNCNASLDRIDSSIGYTVDNIQWIYKPINLMKKDFNDHYFIKMCSLISENYLNTGISNTSK
jgi:hypothetical protein